MTDLAPDSPPPHEPPAADYSIPGFRVAPVANGGDVVLEVRAHQRPSGWKLHPGTSAERPTALIYRGQHYRILSEEQVTGGWRYLLARWFDAERAWKSVELSPDAFAAEVIARSEHNRSQRRELFSFPLMFVAGVLPSRWQRRLADEFPFPTEWATRVFGFYCIALGVLVALIAAAFASIVILAIALLLLLNGIVQLAAPTAGHDALGPLPLELIDWLLQGAPMGYRHPDQ